MSGKRKVKSEHEYSMGITMKTKAHNKVKRKVIRNNYVRKGCMYCIRGIDFLPLY